MENSYLNGPENNNEITPDQKLEDLQFLSEMAKETGFIETPEMKELRKIPSEWVEKAQELVESAEKDSPARKRLFVGYLIELIGICLEQNDRDEYFKNVDYAAQAARSIGDIALAEKIETF